MRRVCFSFILLFTFATTTSFSDEATDESGFRLLHWFEKGIDHGNPMFNNRIRVNSPEAAFHPSFRDRKEVRANGMFQIQLEENVYEQESAELYLEMWGGHPGTFNKRVTVNGRSAYSLPDKAEEKHCTYTYPTIPLKISDLLRGYNVFQFACDQGETFWGHFIIDNACLKTKPNATVVEALGFKGFEAHVAAKTSDNETVELDLQIPDQWKPKITRVDFYGFYDGYNENGSGQTPGWHGFTKNREPQAIIGSSNEPPFQIEWNTTMLPAQDDVKVRAVVSFDDLANLTYTTQPSEPFTIEKPDGIAVTMYGSNDIPAPFWSRADRLQECSIELDIDPKTIEAAHLHVVLWDGGSGTTETPFTLNGSPLPAAGEGRHDVLYRDLQINPSLLQKGKNVIQVLSDTEHHGIEVIYPGPALIVRYKHKLY